MFDNLSEKLGSVFKKVTGKGRLSEKNIADALKEVRLSLLEADVNFKVVREFTESVRARAIGQEVMGSLTPGQQFVKIVHEELIRLMGGAFAPLDLSGPPPVALMLVGLQGSGKTTTAGKLAKFLAGKGKKPYLVPADVYRPAAIEQLETLAGQLALPVYHSEPDQDPVDICRRASLQAEMSGCDTLIIDTAGRLQIDAPLMEELQRIKATIAPTEILFVADAMTGQEAVNVAAKFNEDLDVTGVILTKLDGDARGGAALSIRAVTGKPIKFVGVGEKLDALEIFHPDRIASRILGMGDILTLIEKAQQDFDEKKARELEKRLRKNQFTLEDFRDQLLQIKKMGGIQQIVSMLPGMAKMKAMRNIQADEQELVRIEAIINSMTPEERRNHTILNGSRRRRIARGSGTSVQDVNRLLKRYLELRKMMKKFTRTGGKGMRLPF